MAILTLRPFESLDMVQIIDAAEQELENALFEDDNAADAVAAEEF